MESLTQENTNKLKSAIANASQVKPFFFVLVFFY